jgi:hypothetical protein
MLNKNFVIPVIDLNDEAKFVPSDIEYRKRACPYVHAAVFAIVYNMLLRELRKPLDFSGRCALVTSAQS